MIEMQGVPMFDDAIFASGAEGKLFDHKIVSASALRKMAGNSFSQPCMTAFIAFSLAHLKHKRASDANVIPTAAASSHTSHIVYMSDKNDAEMYQSDEEAEDIS